MRGISDRYIETLARSHDQLGYVDVLKDGDLVMRIGAGNFIDPETGAPVFALGGSIDMSRSAVRRQGTINFLDPTGSLHPLASQDLFSPFVTEIRPYIGLRYWDARVSPVDELASWQTATQVVNIPQPTAGDAITLGTTLGAGDSGSASTSSAIAGNATVPGLGRTTVTVDVPVPPVFEVEAEYVPLGTMVITNPSTNHPTISLTCMDRMWYLDQFTAPYVIAKGTPIVDALQDLLTLKIPASVLDTNFPSDLGTVGSQLVYDANSSVQDALLQIARLAGTLVQCDPMGVFIAPDSPLTTDDPVFTYTTGDLDPTNPRMLRCYRPQQTIGTGTPYNAVVYTSESTAAAPLRGYAQDNNPRSLTYVGRIGIHPYFAASPLLTTQEQLNLAARTRLQGLLGLSNTYSVPILPNHALEVDDVIRVIDDDRGLDLPMIIDSTNVPMRASDGVQTLTCRTHVVNPDDNA